MDTQHADSKRHILSGQKLSSSFYKLIIVGTFLCILLLANHTEIPETVVKGRTKPDKPKLSNTKFKIQDSVKAITITTAAETFKGTVKTDKEITTQEIIATVSTKVERIWQESRNKLVQTNKLNATTNDSAVHTNISLDGSGLVTPQIANLESDAKHTKEDGEEIDKTDRKDKNTKMDKGNISVEGSRQVIPHGVNKVANVKADGKDFGEERKTIDKTEQRDKTITMNKENVSVEGSQEIASHGVNKEANAAVKDMRREGKQLDKDDKGDVNSKFEKEDIRHKETYMISNNKAKYINTNKDNSDEDRRPKKIKHYGTDDGSDYIKTKYVLQKFLKDNGPNLSAKQRAKLVQERCQQFIKENNVRLNQHAQLKYGNESFLISRRYNVSICYNCKVASTNTKRVLYAIDNKFTDDINSIKQHAAREYSKSRAKTFQEVMSDKRHVNVMMVREPLERLLSAYRDGRAFKGKFEDPSFSFKHYLQLVLDTNLKQMNRHIYPYFERCRPCEMQYDFIGLQLNFNDDIKTVLQEIGASGKVDIPKRKKTGYNYVSSDKMLKQYFNKVPNDVIHKLWEKYYKDYYIFGFPYPAHLMNS